MDHDMGGILLKAVSSGRTRQVRLLLESGIDPDISDDCGQTALIRAVFLDNVKCREKIIKILLMYGAAVSKSDVVGRNALLWAALYGRCKEVAWFTENGDVDLDINARDMNGATALYHAVCSGSAATVKNLVQALKKYGLSVDTPTLNGVSPLMQASMLGHDVCGSILKSLGGATVDLNNCNGENETEIAKKWAMRTLLDKKPETKSKFPPILSQAIAQKIKFRENRAEQLRVIIPQGSDDEDSYGSEVSYYTDKSFEQIHIDTPRNPSEASDWMSSPGNIGTVSLTSSTEVNARSTTDEADAYSTPVLEKKAKKLFQPAKDLHQLFRIQEEVKSNSYREPVTPIEETPSPSISGSRSNTPRKAKKKNKGNLAEFKKQLFRHVADMEELQTRVSPTRFPETEATSRQSLLPRICQAALVQNRTEKPAIKQNNYSDL